MTRNIPLALLIVAVILAIPSLGSTFTTSVEPATVVPTLTPGHASTGRLPVDQRVDFWRQRVDGPADALNRIQLATALLEQARQSGDPSHYQQSLITIDEALEANPLSMDARTVRGAALAADHRFEEALEESRAVLMNEPASFQAHAVAGDSLLELGRTDEAAVHFDALLRLQPNAPAALARNAELAWDSNDPDGARDLARRALSQANEARLDAGELSFYAIRLARMELDVGEIDTAAALAAEARRIAPGVPSVQATWGFALEARGDLVGAVSAHLEAIDVSPIRESLEALVALADGGEQVDGIDEIRAALLAMGPRLYS